MKLVVTVIFTCIMIIIPLYAGCSKEEKFQDSKQVQVIKQSMPQKPKKVTESQISANEPQIEIALKKEVVLKDDNNKAEVNVDRKQAPASKENKGYYVVKKGESLKDIAEKQDILADPLKWPVLLRLNIDEIKKMEIDEALPSRRLSEGMKLRIYSPEEQERLLNSRKDDYWVINVLSAKTDIKIVPVALKLIMYGYPAYISRVRIKGEDWMRLRVGFYNKKDDANKEGNKIMDQLQLKDIWTTKVDEAELHEFGKY